MTTIAEFKKMLRQEINEPLDYPRVPGLSALELEDYNRGYREGCRIVTKTDPDVSDAIWVDARIVSLTHFVKAPVFVDDDPYFWGKQAAYTWALGELKGLEPETPNPWGVIADWLGGTNTPAGVLGRAIDEIKENEQSQILSGLNPCFDAPDSVLVPRARYNYLLDLERSVSEFTESFTKWEA